MVVYLVDDLIKKGCADLC